MILRAVLAAAVLLAAASVLVGCGSEKPSDDRTLSKREYIARADEMQGEVQDVFTSLDGRLPATRTQAATRIAALDDLIAGYELLVPPPAWRDEHAKMLQALGQMRQSLVVVSRASAGNRTAIEYQVGRYQAAQADFTQAVDEINASR
jgi:Mg2+ and Co2+ transporter CorA